MKHRGVNKNPGQTKDTAIGNIVCSKRRSKVFYFFRSLVSSFIILTECSFNLVKILPEYVHGHCNGRFLYLCRVLIHLDLI